MNFLKNKRLLITIAVIVLCLYIAVPRILAWFGKQAQMKAMMMPVKVEVVNPHYENIYKQIESSGRLDAKFSVDIVARVQGWLEKSYFKEGDYVKEGTTLFLIEPNEYKIAVNKAQAALKETKANLINAEKDLARAEELVKQDYVSKAYYDQVLAKRDSLKAALGVQQSALEGAKLNLSYTTIKAPVSGKIGKIIITQGNLVNAQSGPLAKLVSTSPIYAYFTIKSDDYLDFKKSAKEGDKEGLDSMVVNIILSDGSKYPEDGKVEFVDNVVDTNLGTISLRATFSNKDNSLVPGDFIKVTATSKEAQKKLLVPMEAVQESEKGMYVAKVNDDNVVEQQFITTSGQKGDCWIVSEGLEENDKVITKGLQKVRVGGKVEIIQPSEDKQNENDKDKK